MLILTEKKLLKDGLKNVGKNQDVKNKPMLKSGEKVVI